MGWNSGGAVRDKGKAEVIGMNKPLISVIMSVFNEEKYIAAAVNSILAQTEDNFEIIIIDDCSTDATSEIIAEIAEKDAESRTEKISRIRLIHNEANQGLTRNLNKALDLAKGSYIARMDGDDISCPGRFETQLKYLREHPELMLVSCNHITFGDKVLISDTAGSPEELRCRMLLRPQLAHPGFMMRAELVKEYGYRYDEHFRSAQDYDFAVRVAKSFSVGVTPETLLEYRAHKGQVSSYSSAGQLGYADEIRKRQLEELGLTLEDDEYAIYRSWALEEPVSKEKYITAKLLLNRIFEQNAGLWNKKGTDYLCKPNVGADINGLSERKMHTNNVSAHPYNSRILIRTLWKQYFVWMLRAGGLKYAGAVCGLNPVLYARLIAAGAGLMVSKRRRRPLSKATASKVTLHDMPV